MKNKRGKLRKYVVVIAFIVTFIALYLTLKDTKEKPIVLVINLFLYGILIIDIIDCLIKAANGKPVAMARHGIGILFIFPVIVTLCNKDYQTNLQFMSIVLFAYDIYTLIFYIAAGLDDGDCSMLKSKLGLIKGFLLDAPPKFIIGTFCIIIAKKANYVTDSNTHKNIMKFSLDTLKTCERLAFICIFIYSALLILFIVLDIIKKNKNPKENYDNEKYRPSKEEIALMREKFQKMLDTKPTYNPNDYDD